MENGINLSLTKSLADFDKLLDQAIETVSKKNLSVSNERGENNSWQIGKYVQINDEGKGEDEETATFWIGFGWEENDNRESSIWLEFDAENCPAKYWEKINALVGTSGKYYSDVDFEFAQVYMNAWVHFFLKKEYLEQFYDANTGIRAQLEILTGFINEVLNKL